MPFTSLLDDNYFTDSQATLTKKLTDIYNGAPLYDADGKSLYGPEGRYSNFFGGHIKPRLGYTYPEPGDQITALEDYRTPAANSAPETGIIRKGDVGKVTGIRKPALDRLGGYYGLIVEFNRIKPSYRGGVVIPWDSASDATLFKAEKPQP